MPDVLKALFGTPQYVSRADTGPDFPDADPNDIWAFTDPDAREEYSRRAELRQLEQDIRYEVMRGGPWQPEELEYKSEVRRLIREGVLTDKGTYWFRSPHPTVYLARRDGVISVAERIQRFRAGDEVVFQCRMERDEEADDTGPALVARLQPAERVML